ncbi:MAG: hypothetical protein H6500_03390 [Candidatus Woesearchaeota archaeon]|nr:MAG: hypothetical protein H6500_03390 [Candidatus Woesearchaeota archaeon]
MERKIEIRKEKGRPLSGILTYRKQSKNLIIFVVGLGGTKEQHIFYNAAKYFPKEHYDTFRFDFSSEKEENALSEGSIVFFKEDLNEVLSYFETRYENIFLVAHSFGACVVIGAKHEVAKKLVFWDGAFFPKTKESEEFNKNYFEYIESLDKYVFKGKIEFLVSKQLVEERINQDERILGQIKTPLKLIMAENFFLKENWSKYLNLLNIPYEFLIVEGAGHNFDEQGKEKKLFAETLLYLKENKTS